MASQQFLVSIKAGIRAKKGLHLVEGGSVAAAWQQRGAIQNVLMGLSGEKKKKSFLFFFNRGSQP